MIILYSPGLYSIVSAASPKGEEGSKSILLGPN
jgi:hypothetical protein